MIATSTDTDYTVSAAAHTKRKAFLLANGQRLYPLFLTVSRASTTVKVPVLVGETEVRVPEDWTDCSAAFQDWIADYLAFAKEIVEQHQLGVDETKQLFTLRLKRLLGNYEIAPPSLFTVPEEEVDDPEPELETESEPEPEPERKAVIHEFIPHHSPPLENLILQRVVLKRQAGIHLLDPEEAAAVLGIPINGRVNVKMAWLISHGFIERFSRNGQKTYFWRADLDQLAVRIANGEVNIPTT